jgi:hypothetical protein
MKSVLLYLVLVGTPFLGLLGILRVGETLDAPVSIEGSWEIDRPTTEALERACAPLETAEDRLEMTVAQSGQYVQVRFSDMEQTSMIGRLHVGTLTVREVIACSAPARSICGTATMVVLQIRLRRQSGEADELTGWWKMPECDACPRQSFRALRLVES